MSELDFLLKKLKSWNLHTRTNAARKLKKFKDPRITPALCKALLDLPLQRRVKYWQLNWANLRSYSLPLTYRTLRWETNVLFYRSAIFEALIAQNDPRAVKSLKKRLREGYYRDKDKTLAAINHFEGEEVWEILCDTLVGKYGFLETQAAEYLFQRDKNRAIKPLISAFSMSHMDNPRKGDWISTAELRYHIQQKLIEILTRIGKPAFDDLINALEHPNLLLRDGVVKTLKELGDKRAVEALWKVKDTTPYAIVSVSHLDYENTVGHLIEKLENYVPHYFEYIEDVADILGAYREEKAVPVLASYLDSLKRPVDYPANLGYGYPLYLGSVASALEKIGSPLALSAVERFRAKISPLPP
jgi:HEAT repeat protein